MKKFVSLLCMIACVFGLTACGSSEDYTAYEQSKIEMAKQVAVEAVIPAMENFRDPALKAEFSEYTAEEVEYIVMQDVGINADGYGFLTAVESFVSAYETVGYTVSIGEATAKIDDKQIIVYVDVEGDVQSAEAEVIFTNDMFMKLESAALNPTETMGDLMVKAALNTLIGMGTVFVVLVLISGIIAAFAFIPKLQAAFSKKEKKEETKAAPAPVAMEVVEEAADESDDLELVAVIAAAIAAYEGAASTDGFVVRSIRKVRR